MKELIIKSITFGAVKGELRESVIEVIKNNKTAYEAAQDLGNINKQATIRNNIDKVIQAFIMLIYNEVASKVDPTDTHELVIYTEGGSTHYKNNLSTLLRYINYRENLFELEFEINKVRIEDNEVIESETVFSFR
ncbi:hypothetical protein MX824_003896 [Vibrio parahaemolyticus]|nr:hypothetical protein [Vibrio parahaemolyticus]EJC6812432.1 hypothetical protein [Vibrio parahaemolyticus]EJC6927016.1 hypothetical protein [Vibrio parahaemolyticus]EJC6941232.1 hypothetical protein [Vibrio parahaemolyticus]EJC6974204.1 hypothetical protein [Vibrio parahaemolyticus]